jgi:hypothetical protein
MRTGRKSRERIEQFHSDLASHWTSVRSDIHYLLIHRAFDPDYLAHDEDPVLTDIDLFVASLSTWNLPPTLPDSLLDFVAVKWSRLLDIFSHDNFASLLAPLVPRFRAHRSALNQNPDLRREDFQNFAGLYAALKIAEEELRRENHEIREFLPNLGFALGSVAYLVRPGFSKELQNLPGDAVQLGDCVELMEKWRALKSEVERWGVEILKGAIETVAYLNEFGQEEAKNLQKENARLKANLAGLENLAAQE